MKPPTNAAPDTTILAATERAERHHARPHAGVAIWTILDHLAIRKRTAAARHIRTRLAVLQATDLLKRGRRNGIEVWTLTRAGHEQLAASRTAGELADLPGPNTAHGATPAPPPPRTLPASAMNSQTNSKPHSHS